VRSTSPLVALLAVAVAPAAAVAAGPAGFSDPVAVGTGVASATAGALSDDGGGALAWTGVDRTGPALHVALRDDARQPWRASALGVGAREVRDPQLAIAPDGTAVLAWAEVAGGRRRQAVALAAAAPGGDFGAVRRLAVGNAFAAFPRLVVARSGAILLAFRDAPSVPAPARLRLAVRPASGGRFGAPRTLATRVSSLALAAPGEGAVVAWSTPPPRIGADRTLYALRLDDRGGARGRPLPISRAAGAEVRLAGSPEGFWIVSWVRPRAPGRPLALFTRTVLQSLRPARPLEPPVGTIFGGAAAVSMAISGRALVTATALGPGGVRVFAARSVFGGPWTAHQELTAKPGAVIGDPRPVLFGEPFVVWTHPRDQPGEPVYDVLVARRVGQVAFAPPEALSAGAPAGRAGGLLVAIGGEHVLVAWAAPGGGLLAVERG
jgi:hypothetical protein